MQEFDEKSINLTFKKIDKLIYKKEYKEARKLLIDYIDKTKDKYILKNKRCYSFRNLTEFYIYINLFNKKDVNFINLFCDKAYQLLAYICVEEGNYNDAINYLDISFKYNPINLDSFFELVETYKMLYNFDKMKETLDNLYVYIYNSDDLSRYYRNLGFYYIEKEKYDIAFSLYLISLDYKYSDFALSEMIYIRNKLNDNNYNITKTNAIKLLKENHINIGINKKNLSLLNNLVNDKKLLSNNLEYVKSLKEDINKLTKKIK